MRRAVIFLLSLLVIGRVFTLTAKAAEKIPVIAAESSFSFGEKTAALKKSNAQKKKSSLNDISKYASQCLVVKMKKVPSNCSAFFGKYGAVKIVDGPRGLYGLQFASASAAKTAAIKLNRLSSVKYAEPEYLCQSKTSVTGYRPMSYGTTRIRSASLVEQMLKNVSTSGITVAVVDSGIARNRKIASRVLTTGYNFIGHNKNTKDEDGHGTHVAGIIWDVTYGLRVNLLPVKVLDQNGQGDTYSLVNGINYAVSKGAKVINISITLAFDPVTGRPVHSEYLHEAIKEAISKGVIVVCAAGNDGVNVKNACPADIENAITVGAIDKRNQRTVYSNYGDLLDVVAPGADIKSTGITGMVTMSGTSMAAPHVSGVAAILKMLFPSYAPKKIENFIKKNTDDLGTAGKDKYYGYGVPNLKKIRIVTAKKVTLNHTKKTIPVKNSFVIKATVVPSDTTQKMITWSSNNKKVALVKEGKVVALSPGTAKITATTANGKKAVCTVTVRK